MRSRTNCKLPAKYPPPCHPAGVWTRTLDIAQSLHPTCSHTCHNTSPFPSPYPGSCFRTSTCMKSAQPTAIRHGAAPRGGHFIVRPDLICPAYICLSRSLSTTGKRTVPCPRAAEPSARNKSFSMIWIALTIAEIREVTGLIRKSRPTIDTMLSIRLTAFGIRLMTAMTAEKKRSSATDHCCPFQPGIFFK